MIGWAPPTLAASALLMLLVLVLRRPVAARFGARAAYALWALPALRMLLPPLPAAALPAPVPAALDVDALLRAAATAPVAAAAPTGAAATAAPDWPALLLAAWLIGAIAFLAVQLLRYRRFLRRADDLGAPGHRHRRVLIRHSAAVAGPIAAGLWRRQVLLPDDFRARYAPPERRQVLAHELAHHRRGDLIANAAALLLLALHWFNPLAHLAYRAFRADQELACDATVLARADAQARAAYATALVKSVRAAVPAAACAIGPAPLLKRRMRMLVRPPFGTRRHAAGLALAAATILGGLTLTASRAGALVYADPVPFYSTYDGSAGGPAATPGPTPVAATPQPAPAAPVRTASEPRHAARAAPAAPAAPVAPATPAPPAAPDDRRDEAVASAETMQVPPPGWTPPEARAAVAHARELQGLGARIRRQVMAETRAALAQSCTHAAMASGPETDAEALARLSRGCVDRRAIAAQVALGLARARESVAATEMSAEARAHAMAAIDRAEARYAARATQ